MLILSSPLNGYRRPVCTHRESAHCVDKPDGGSILPLSLFALLLAPGGWGRSNEPWTLMLPDCSKMFFLHYLGNRDEKDSSVQALSLWAGRKGVRSQTKKGWSYSCSQLLDGEAVP